MEKNERPLLRSIGIGLAIIVAVIIYAYGFSVTEVNFETTRSEERLTQLTRILRALAHPDIFEFEKEEFDVDVPIYLPCPPGGPPVLEPDTGGPYLVLSPACAGAREIVEVEGFNMPPETQGPINFVALSGVKLTLGNFTTDPRGQFKIEVELPNRQPVDEPQTIRATARRNVGLPRLSSTALGTIDKIIETVFIALLATTFGTILAIPVSFFAARNLMSDVKSPLSSVALLILGWPLGIALGLQVARWVGEASQMLSSTNLAAMGGVVVSPLAIWGIFRWAVPPVKEELPGWPTRASRALALGVAAVLFILVLYLVATLGFAFGEWLEDQLGSFGFLGGFIFQLSDVLNIAIPTVVGLAGGGFVSSLTGRVGRYIADRMSAGAARSINFIAAAAAGAVLFALVSTGIDWLYQLENPVVTLWWPAGIGAVAGLAVAVRVGPRKPLRLGMAVYYVTRTILNAARSIEPLIYVIIFVVWAGIGPFAGALALGLHTIAALAKLYSEQVESILPGPLEAVRATGANRLQTIVYAVIPQIIPPYISFTMYRWDINVRMSTIIGFGGGGGIGFLLLQNIRLLDYRAASAQMLAIAVVVATMDYISSTLRERYV